VNSRTLTMALGDVAGKGISAAILMASVQSALRAQIRHTEEAGTPCFAFGDGQPAQQAPARPYRFARRSTPRSGLASTTKRAGC
jgi:hypothetical protein